MPLLIMLLIAVCVSVFATYVDISRAKKAVVLINNTNACPPHQWLWEEQLGMPGAWFIRCQRCRRLPTLETGRDEE